jgi:hypothetical protein
MNNWIKKHFSNVDKSLATLSTFGLSMGVTGFAIVMVGVYLAR